jgi:hypothetical protein
MRELNCTISNMAVRNITFGLTVVASIILFAISLPAIAQTSPGTTMPSDAEIRNILIERIDKHQSVGIVVGVIDSSGRRIVSYGNLATGDKRTLDGNTIFDNPDGQGRATELVLHQNGDHTAKRIQ